MIMRMTTMTTMTRVKAAAVEWLRCLLSQACMI